MDPALLRIPSCRPPTAHRSLAQDYPSAANRHPTAPDDAPDDSETFADTLEILCPRRSPCPESSASNYLSRHYLASPAKQREPPLHPHREPLPVAQQIQRALA